jgi:hypothetical protein
MKRFNNLCDVRRYLASIIRRLEAGELTESRAKTLAYVSNILRGVMESSDIEERIQKLEATYEKLSKAC